MNARRIAGPNAIFLPDPWCTTETPYPDTMKAFHRLIAQQVQEYTNRAHRMSIIDLWQFFSFLVTHGLSLITVTAIASQLLKEITSEYDETWRRVVLLDKLLFDVFKYYFRTNKPEFSTFFTNSTAHLQHAYWRHMAPTQFSVQPDQLAIARFGDAILFGYREMDRQLGDFMRLAGSHTTLMFATALSQQPYLKYEASGGHRFYRPRSMPALLAQINLRPERIEPVMTHEFLIHFGSPAEAEQARRRLGAITSNSKSVFNFDPSEPKSVYLSCQLRTEIPLDATLTFGDGKTTKFFDHFYQIEGMKSGRHHPDGCLWIRNGTHKVATDKVSILDVLPTILGFFGLPARGYAGRSLIGGEARVPMPLSA